MKKTNILMHKLFVITLLVLFLLLCTVGCEVFDKAPTDTDQVEDLENEEDIEVSIERFAFLSQVDWGYGDLIIHFMDVGQGDGFFVQLPDGTTMLIDGGNVLLNPHKYIKSYLSALNISKNIDYVFLTHPHKDHCNGLAKVIQDYNIKYFYTPKITDKQENNASYRSYLNSMERAVKKGAEIIYNIDKVEVLPKKDLYPFSFVINGLSEEEYDQINSKSERDDINNLSPITVIEYMGKRVVLTGDAIKKTEYRFLELFSDQEMLKTDVLKVGHHGSKTSTSAEFIEFLQPDNAILTVGGYTNHPHSQTLKTLNAANEAMNILRTDHHGAIILKITQDGQLSFLTEKQIA